jgi:plasmid stabilization system protein ParE
MGYQVALAPSARADLREIVRYIALDAPGRALDFGQFLAGQVGRLGE